ncbi:divergent polysaccharide deacetylase family protein [Enterovirga rhinocerotis]|uniref:Divergent polysaccharide deacetylase n=1 Tax=Enterovirga rhinocerotis TaxID=1339210 RepID=A0A4V3DYU8_9HYPH|nr:divergent polysaccharide deacetylase family protein [Enterovirga rhinocerotis]TDR94019.1 hypothetical protein EV668_1289 [Enterovirga rhinocerotis]
MTAAPDDLTRPLGLNRPKRGSRRPVGRIAGVALGIALAGLIAVFLGSAIYGDPRGGRPVARTEIVVRGPAEAAPAAQQPAARPDQMPGRRDAGTVEADSGVHVVRGGGAEAPPAIVVAVPDAVSRRLPATPDLRLVEESRHGALPRIGPDGARAIEVYARPEGELPGGRQPLGRIALVVGGLGLSRTATEEAISRLPPAVTLAFAPYGLDLARESRRARDAGHEIMLQIPMEPFDYPDSDPGPRTLMAGSKSSENAENLRWAMGRFTGYVGLMNYMGGKLTADDKALQPILREAGQRGLGILDDGSSSRSRIGILAGETRSGRADVVVDAVPRADLIDAALGRLETLALSGKLAVATASALPVTIERIARWSETLEARGILLVPATAALGGQRRESASR